jgi:preprotein translocase subunit YajC
MELTQFAPFFVMFVVIYFFMIRPQQKKLKMKRI